MCPGDEKVRWTANRRYVGGKVWSLTPRLLTRRKNCEHWYGPFTFIPSVGITPVLGGHVMSREAAFPAITLAHPARGRPGPHRRPESPGRPPGASSGESPPPHPTRAATSAPLVARPVAVTGPQRGGHLTLTSVIKWRSARFSASPVSPARGGRPPLRSRSLAGRRGGGVLASSGRETRHRRHLTPTSLFAFITSGGRK